MKLVASKLKTGDEVRVIAPSSSLQIISKENINDAVSAIEALGLKVTFGKNVNEIDKMSSSSVHSRIEDIHEAFADKNVKAILFIEADSISEGNVDTYEFDRDLQSLIHQANFDKVQGILIGRFEKKFNIDLEKLKLILSTKRELKNLPIIANADFGHTNPLFTYPVGGMCEMSAHQGSVKIELSEERENE